SGETSVFFFFQAEDGIRDWSVTGVQTCALPIFPAWLERSEALLVRGRFLDCDCLLGPLEQPFHVAIRAGRIVDLTPAPVLMRSRSEERRVGKECRSRGSRDH